MDKARKDIIRVKLECQGFRPLIMDPKTEEIRDNIRTGEKKPSSPKITGISKEDEAGKKVIKDETGKIGIPSDYLVMSLINAGKNKKYKKELGLTTSDGSFVTSLISIEEDFLPLTGDGKWAVDERTVPTKSGGSQVSIRPKFKEWGFKVVIAIDGDISENIIKKLFEESGRFIGVGAARKLGFGRFKVVSWESID